MKLSTLIEKDLILINQNIASREEAVSLAVDLLFEKKKIKNDKKLILQEIYERDKLGGTVFSTGLAVPHARVKDYDDLTIIFCLPREPVVIEGISVSCFVIMITSAVVSNLYLQVLSNITKMSMDETFFKSLTSAESQDDILELLSTIYIKKELTVDDIMSTDFGSISPEANLKELTDQFYLKKTSYLPVIDDKKNFIGEVRINDLIAVGIPDYAVMIGNLSFLKSFEPFEKLLLEEENIMVKDIMKKTAVTLNTGATVVEAALKMTKGNYRHLPVVKDGGLMGILNILDILTKVLRS